MKNQIVLHRAHRVGYVRTYRAAGARLVEIGDTDRTEEWELEAAINRKTAAVAYVFGPKMGGAIPLETVIEIAHARGVPVIVDAAAMLPPVENLTRYVAAGADMVSFSGGKGVLGPQSTGILCGTKELIEAAYMNSAPHSEGVGRPAKVPKEEIAGLVTALELFVDTDQDAQRATWHNMAEVVVSGLQGIKGVTATLVDARPELQDSHSGHARAIVTWDAATTGLSDDDVIARLKEGNPPIYLGTAGPEGGIAVVPVNLREGEAEIIAERLRGILGKEGA
jgi:L-seryl-tRNA(Ser) seleniumtransferase